jgi:acetolactate synthase-1/3 small subunit
MPMSEPTLTVLFAERIGALDRIVSLLRRRGFPISGMSLERTHQSDVRRMSVGVHQVSALPQVQRHLARLPDVLEVTVTDGEALHREYALLRVRCIAAERGEILAILAAFDARALSFSESHVVVEATGFTQQIEALFTALSTYGIEESARTNPIALRRMSGTADSEHARQSA